MEKDSIIRKINSLLRLADSGDEHEAELASNKAFELIAKYNLTKTDLVKDDYITTELFTGGKLAYYHNHIYMILREFFHVESWARRDRNARTSSVMVAGSKTNVEIAKHVFDFLSLTFKSQWKTFQKEEGCSLSERSSFTFGLYRGIKSSLTTKKKQLEERGLVIVADAGLKEYLCGTKIRQKFSRISVSSSDVYNQGVRKGGEISIAKAVRSADNSSRLLTN